MACERVGTRRGGVSWGRVNRIPGNGSGVIGEHAVIAGLPAALLSRMLADWRRQLPPGVRPEQVRAVEEAVGALRVAASEHITAAQRERLPAGGNGEGHAAGGSPESQPWMTTKDAAALLGTSPRRVRQLGEEGTLDSIMVDGRRMWPSEQVSRRATGTATSAPT